MARILVIDDEQMIRLYLRQALTMAGHEVGEAVNGKDGVQKYTASQWDLVITDIIMPEQEGIETVTLLRRANPQAKIIAISGGGRIGNTDFLQMAKQIGAGDVLKKPFKKSELLATVQRMLGEVKPAAATG
ncbi:MAG: response regulator [Rhodospirillales bacterium]|nr:response regulator [Rhodospirillales bacterium]